MDSKHLHAILQEIWANINCKQCNEKLDINNVKLLKQAENTANFEIKCTRCWGLMQVSAEMSKEKPKIGKNIEKESNTKHFLKWRMIETIIKDDEVSIVSKMLNKASTFKDIFWVFLICVTVLFSWCWGDSKLWDVRQDILNTIEETKQFWVKTISWSMAVYGEVSEVVRSAPGKIEEIKAEAGNIINEAKELKDDTQETFQKTRDALNKINEAADAAKQAADAIGDIWK